MRPSESHFKEPHLQMQNSLMTLWVTEQSRKNRPFCLREWFFSLKIIKTLELVPKRKLERWEDAGLSYRSEATGLPGSQARENNRPEDLHVSICLWETWPYLPHSCPLSQQTGCPFFPPGHLQLFSFVFSLLRVHEPAEVAKHL